MRLMCSVLASKLEKWRESAPQGDDKEKRENEKMVSEKSPAQRAALYRKAKDDFRLEAEKAR